MLTIPNYVSIIPSGKVTAQTPAGTRRKRPIYRSLPGLAGPEVLYVYYKFASPAPRFPSYGP